MASFSKRVHVYFMDIHQMKRAFDLYYPDYLRSDYKIRMARDDSIRKAQQDSIEAIRVKKAKEEEDRQRKKAIDNFMNL